MLNWLEPETILFVWRDTKTNGTKVISLFEHIPKLREDLDFLGPGEIWLFTDSQKLMELAEKSIQE